MSLTADKLGFSTVTTLHLERADRLPFDDEEFDGIWADGRWLTRYGRDAILREASRVLRKGGRLHLARCPAVGEIIVEALTDESGVDVVEAVRQGPARGGIGAFVATGQLHAILKPFGLSTVKTLPPQPIRIGGGNIDLSGTGSNHLTLASRLRSEDFVASLRADLSLLAGVERSVSFTAIRH